MEWDKKDSIGQAELRPTGWPLSELYALRELYEQEAGSYGHNPTPRPPAHRGIGPTPRWERNGLGLRLIGYAVGLFG